MKILKGIILILLTTLISCQKDEVLPIKKEIATLKDSNTISNKVQWLVLPNEYASVIQLDYNLDGKDDILTFDSYDVNVPYTWPGPQFYSSNPISNVTSTIEIDNKKIFGSKLLVGDFDKNGYPDVFVVTGMDGAGCGNCMPPILSTYIMFNKNGKSFYTKELSEWKSAWFTATSGDIDNDGDLDVILFNTRHDLSVNNKLLLNDGAGNFASSKFGLEDSVKRASRSELIDVNKDGFLDLVVDDVTFPDNGFGNLNYEFPNRYVIISWGNGKNFTMDNSIKIQIANDMHLLDIDAYDFDKDGYNELVLPMNYLDGNWKVFVYKTINNITYANSNMIESNTISANRHIPHSELISIKDLDSNGKMDIFVNDKKANLRWEFDIDKLKLK